MDVVALVVKYHQAEFTCTQRFIIVLYTLCQIGMN